MALTWLQDIFVTVAGSNPVMQGLAGGIVITLLNSLGALAILIWRRPSERFLDMALGFAAGVMLTASFTSLILPGIERGGIGSVLAGIVLGALVLDLVDHNIPTCTRVLAVRKVELRAGSEPSGSLLSPSRYITCRKDWRSVSALAPAMSAMP